MHRDTSVLLVEPAQADAKAIRRALARQGGEPSVAVVALKDALLDGLLRWPEDQGELDPQVIVLDLWANSDAWPVLLRQLRQRADTKAAAVVVLGPPDDDWAVLRAHALGADAFLTKPEGVDGLAAAVREVASYWLSVHRSDAAEPGEPGSTSP